jgi:hypothetical protein
MLVAMSRPAGQFSVSLGELRAALYAAAGRAGLSPSVLLRQALAVELERRAVAGGDRPVRPTTAASPSPQSRLRGATDAAVEVRVVLPASDAARVTAAARRERMSRSEYLAVVVTAALEAGWGPAIGGPLPGARRAAPPVENKDLGGLRDALVASTVQVGAVGRNVNQIARSLHITPGVLSARDRGDLVRLVPVIEAHVAAAGAVLSVLRPVVGVRRAKRREDGGRGGRGAARVG